jgi:hypothetical protein
LLMAREKVLHPTHRERHTQLATIEARWLSVIHMAPSPRH